MLMILTHIAYIGQMFKLTSGQGHKIKGQVQICIDVKRLEKSVKIIGLIGVDDTYTYCLHG